MDLQGVCVGGGGVYIDIPRYKVFKLFDIYMYTLLAMYKKRVLKNLPMITLLKTLYLKIHAPSKPKNMALNDPEVVEIAPAMFSVPTVI